MVAPWNLTSSQWSGVLLNGTKPEVLGTKLLGGTFTAWTDVLLKFSNPKDRILDLGSGRGEHSAILALHGRRTTLLDWSTENIRYSSRVFQAMGVDGSFCRADLTKPLPFENNGFDIVFCCGVLEYFTSEQINSILREAFRVSARRVIIMVPNALSVAYRIGKSYMERNAQWRWGGEVPSYSFKRHFRAAGMTRLTEFSVAPDHSLNFLSMPLGGPIREICRRLLRMRDSSKPSLFRQGYLLVTIGEK
jgi:ubiquinone/menaquinone biosynthesis C-methylase UbiE